MNLLATDRIRALLSVSPKPLSEKEISLYTGLELPDTHLGLQALVKELEDYDRVLFLKHSHSGWQLAIRTEFVGMTERFLQEKPFKVSKSCLEVLALIAYHQPLTRSEIENIRGVSLSPNLLKHLFDWEWIEICGHKEVPGKPELLRTTARFLDDFQMNSLKDLPCPEEQVFALHPA